MRSYSVCSSAIEIGAFVLLALAHCSQTEAKGLSLKLEPMRSDILCLEPCKMEVTLRNEGPASLAGIPRLDDMSAPGSLRFYVVFGGATTQIRNAAFGEAIEGSPAPPLELAPGDESVAHFVLTMDWKSEEFIFSKPGLYRVFVKHGTPATAILKSDAVTIRVREPKTASERRAHSLLSRKDVARAYYSGGLIREKNPKEIVDQVKEIYRQEDWTPYHGMAEARLKSWKQLEKRMRRGNFPGGQRRGLDKLGLQDMPLQRGSKRLAEEKNGRPPLAPTKAQSTSTGLPATDRKQIRELFVSFDDAWSKQDIERCMGLFSSDARAFGGGIAHIRKNFKEDFGKAQAQGVSVLMRTSIKEVQGIGEGVVRAEVSQSVSVGEKDPDASRRMSFTLQKVDQQWKIKAMRRSE